MPQRVALSLALATGVAVLWLLASITVLALPPARGVAGATASAAGTFPTTAGDSTLPALGTLDILIHPKFRAMLAGYPGYSGDTGDPATSFRLRLDLSDSATRIGHSAPLTDSSSADLVGVAVGTAGTIVADSHLGPLPPGFHGPSGTREVHTELHALNLYSATTLIGFSAGRLLGAPLSPGEVQSLSGASGDPALDLPAASLFNLRPALSLAPSGDFPGGALGTAEPLLLASDAITAYPPRAVYLQRNPTAIPLTFRYPITVTVDDVEDVTRSWRAGELFGWLVGSGLALGFADTPTDRAEFAQAMQALAPTTPPCDDLDDNGTMDLFDVVAVASRWPLTASDPDPDDDPDTPNFDTAFDLDQNGALTVADIMLIFAQWGRNCRSPGLFPGTVVLNEVMPMSTTASAPWVEIANRGGRAVTLDGALLDDGDGNRYPIPAALPDLPPATFVVVHFDGQGSGADDYDLSDGVAHLHSPAGLVAPFAAAGDDLMLLATPDGRPENLIDFIAWGAAPGSDADLAVAAGLWQPGLALPAERGGVVSGASQPGETVGLLPDQPRGHAEHYAIYRAGEATPGAPNGLPSAPVLLPPDGTLALRQGLSLAWYPVLSASRYQLQIDDDPAFGSPAIDLGLTATAYSPPASLPDGSYFWRLRSFDPYGRASPFSPANSLTLVTAPPILLAGETITHPGATLTTTVWTTDTLPLPALLQRKDTALLCLDGDIEVQARSGGGFNFSRWDQPHADTRGKISTHGLNYCGRATVAMVNRLFGGTLSQDRISYELFGRTGGIGGAADGDPRGDFGHNRTMLVTDLPALLGWALNGATVAQTAGRPPFALYQEYISTSRVPLIAQFPQHVVVLHGFAAYTGNDPRLVGKHFALYTDPETAEVTRAEYESLPILSVTIPVPPPTATLTGRMEESAVTVDSDGDGIMDFDETVRLGTNPMAADSDGDTVLDKADLHSYVFNPHDVPNPRNPNVDGATDGRKESDADNDNDGATDGEEDSANQDGHFDASKCESDPFDPASVPATLLRGTFGTGVLQRQAGSSCIVCTAQFYNYGSYSEIHYTSCRCNPDQTSCRPWSCGPGWRNCFTFSLSQGGPQR